MKTSRPIRAVHGTPITPKRLLPSLDGRSFCVSFARPEQVEDCIELVGEDEILLLDNGAFTIWQSEMKGRKLPKRLQFDTHENYQSAFWDWANEIQARCPQAVAVIPDVITGSEQQNLEAISLAIRYELADFPERTMGVWHMDESTEYLQTLAQVLNYVAIGSCAEYDVQRQQAKYFERLREASAHFQYVEATSGRRVWVHLMRGLGVFHKALRFDSADSCNVAMNHWRDKSDGDERVVILADKIEDKISNASGAQPLWDAPAIWDII